MEQRGEPLLPPKPCGLPYTDQSVGHVFPARCPVHAVLFRVSLGPFPSLHRFRSGQIRLVRRLLRYFERVRLLVIVHHRLRLRLIAFPMRTGACASGRSRDLPVPVQGASVHARVFRPRRADRMLALTHTIVLPSASQTASALRTKLSRLNGWPIRSPADASRTASRRHTHGGADVVRYSFIAVDFHHLLLAGLPAHLAPFFGTTGRCAVSIRPGPRVLCGLSELGASPVPG